MPSTWSLRTQLLLRLMGPLMLLFAIATATSYFIAMHFANLVYDRWLLDSANSLAQEVGVKAGQISFEVPPVALAIFQWDELDKIYFKVEARGAGFLMGSEDIPPPPDWGEVRRKPQFYDAKMRGELVRIVALEIAPPGTMEEVLVQVAETVTKRRSLAGEILTMSVVPQVLLIAVAGVLIWLGVDRGLQPLKSLAEELAARTHHNLSPIVNQAIPVEVRILTDTINSLLQRLSAALSAQQHFIANAAHQLRTPLTALKVQADRALRTHDPESLRPALLQLQASANRVAHLSHQLLTLARASPDFNASQRFMPVDLRALVRETCMEWVPKTLERGIDLGVMTPDRPVVIHGDATMLREMLNNLLDNASRYGQAPGAITVALRTAPRLQLVVEDEGPGIPESHFEQVFERFYRIPGSPGEGCGLGLAIVKEVAHAHGAQVFVRRPDSGVGTQVVVEFSAIA